MFALTLRQATPRRQTRLIVTAGLPGSGKSSIAERLAQRLNIALISIDPIEAALWRGRIPATMTGLAAYDVGEAVADDNLRIGSSVIVDAVNRIAASRGMWRRLSERRQAALTVLECVCSDLQVHRRLNARVRGIAGMPEVTLKRVEQRRAKYEPWRNDRIVLDTAYEPIDRLVDPALASMDEHARPRTD